LSAFAKRNASEVSLHFMIDQVINHKSRIRLPAISKRLSQEKSHTRSIDLLKCSNPYMSHGLSGEETSIFFPASQGALLFVALQSGLDMRVISSIRTYWLSSGGNCRIVALLTNSPPPLCHDQHLSVILPLASDSGYSCTMNALRCPGCY
jgi:hypothetical protein